MKKDIRFVSARHTSVAGLDLIFQVLCLICKIMIYKLPVRDSIDSQNKDRFNHELKEIMEFKDE